MRRSGFTRGRTCAGLPQACLHLAESSLTSSRSQLIYRRAHDICCTEFGQEKDLDSGDMHAINVALQIGQGRGRAAIYEALIQDMMCLQQLPFPARKRKLLRQDK